MSSTSNYSVYKEKARAVMNQTTPTIFKAALVGIGIPILLGWLTGGGGGSGVNFNIDAGTIDTHSLSAFVHSTWGAVTAAVGAALLGVLALMAMLTAVVRSGIDALFSYGFTEYTLRAARGHLGEPKDVFLGFRDPVRVLTAHFIRTFLVWLGAICFLIPGLMIAYSLRMTERVLIDHPELSAVECLKLSRELMRGHRMDLFGLDLSFFGWFILESMTKQISKIYSGTYHALAESYFYEDLYL